MNRVQHHEVPVSLKVERDMRNLRALAEEALPVRARQLKPIYETERLGVLAASDLEFAHG